MFEYNTGVSEGYVRCGVVTFRLGTADWFRLMVHLIQYAGSVRDQHCMLQREV